VEAWGWVSATAGGLLAVTVLADIFFTTLHPDIEGPIAKAVQRSAWAAAVGLGNRLRRIRRQLLAFVGPFMVVLTFVVWVALFIVGIALIVWPNLGSYRAEGEIELLTFFDALYYSGITVSVLGYGDITPVTPWLQLVAVAASLSGFGMLTAVVTYIIELVGSLDERNRLSLRVHDETGGTERGVQLVLRHAPAGTRALEDRYVAWALLARQVEDKLHRYALTSLYYRSRDPAYDPEGTLRIVGEAVVAGYLLATDPEAPVRPAVEELDLATTRLMGTVAEQYLDDTVMDALEAPDVVEDDRRWVEQMSEVMVQALGDRWSPGDLDPAAVATAARLRAFLTALAHLTDWTPADGPLPTGESDHHRTQPKGAG
jgi:hypothetical protein